jgi:hypothetical protein
VAPPPYSLTRQGKDRSILRIDFLYVGDRFEQTITRTGEAGETLAAWRDVHSGDSDDWPASPPIQELSLETIGGQDVLLGVGRAGKSHWSVSIETIDIDSAPAIRFDYACRCPQPPDWLGTTYGPQSADNGDDSTALQVTCGEDSSKVSDGWGASKRIVIKPSDQPQKWPGTVRWRYWIH